MDEGSAPSLEPVPGTPADSRNWYDRASRLYALLTEDLEFPATALAIRGLDLEPGERAVDLGCGSGRGVVEMAGAVDTGDQAVATEGRAVGVDFAPGMCSETARTIRESGLEDRASVIGGNVTALPLRSDRFDGALSSFVLDLMTPSDIESALQETARILAPEGRLATVSIAQSDSVPTRAYRTLRRVFPRQMDCRPIPVVDFLETAGFFVDWQHEYSLYGLPVTIALARL